MKMKKMMNVVLLGMLIILFAGCSSSDSNDNTSPASSAKSIKAFSLNGVEGTINEAEQTVAVTMPSGTSVTALVDTFATTGASVEVGSTIQVSGTTANDFTSPVTYTVIAADATTQDYTVTVTLGASSAKAITAFSLGGVVGTINEAGKTIAVTMPSGTSVTALVATFTTTGASVEVGSTIQVSGTTANDFTSPVTYTVIAADVTTQDYTVTVTLAASSAKAITAFSLGGVVGTINEAAKTIAVTMPSGTSVTALVATFTTTGASVKVGSTIQVSGTTANDFTSPVVYTVTAVDATTQYYTVTTVTEPVNKPATAIVVSMTPNNAGTNPIVAPGAYCARTPSITGSYVVTDVDGGSVIVTEWYDTDQSGKLKLIQSNTITLPSGVTSGSETIYNNSSTPFLHNHIITFKATADGVPSNTASSTKIA
jgi:enhancing lycopene biosynthesis protein 2